VADLAGIDAFSAIPALQTLGSATSTQADIWAAQRSLASISAIPEYQDAPPPPVPLMAAAKVAPETEVTPAVDVQDAGTSKQSNGSYSASFAPTPLALFGSGAGKNSPDNGMRGYGAIANGLRAAIGLGPDPSTTSGAADGGGATP
jgi:hypothetical protein